MCHCTHVFIDWMSIPTWHAQLLFLYCKVYIILNAYMNHQVVHDMSMMFISVWDCPVLENVRNNMENVFQLNNKLLTCLFNDWSSYLNQWSKRCLNPQQLLCMVKTDIRIHSDSSVSSHTHTHVSLSCPIPLRPWLESLRARTVPQSLNPFLIGLLAMLQRLFLAWDHSQTLRWAGEQCIEHSSPKKVTKK